MLKARNYQIKDVLTLSNAQGGAALAAHDVGLGKTLIAVDTIRNLDFQDKIDLSTGRVLLIVPLNTFDGWERTLISQFGEDVPIHTHPAGGKASRRAQRWMESLGNKEPGFYLIGWEAFRGSPNQKQREEYKRIKEAAKLAGEPQPPRPIYRRWDKAGQFEVVIADEVHRASNRKSSTTKTLWTVDAKWKFGLSATPAGNKVENYWAVGHWLWPERYPYFWRWAEEFCSVEPDEYTGKRVVGERKPGKVVKDFPTYIRRTQKQVIKELPQVIEREVLVDMLPAQRKIYTEFEDQALAWLDEHPVATPLPVTQRLRMRQVALGIPTVIPTDEVDEDGFPKVNVTFDQAAKSTKIDALKEIINDLPPDETVLVLTHSARFIPAVTTQLRKAKIFAVEWSGKTSAPGRARIKADFGKPGAPRVIVAGLGAIGEGVDGLQRVCHTEVWLSQHDNNMLNQQAQGRLLRMGQEHAVNRIVLKSRDTIDLKVYERLKENTDEMRKAALG